MKIEIQNLNKAYSPEKFVLQDINLVIEDGLFGLLGPNGAGKTTLMRILVTLLESTSGNIYVNGMDLNKSRRDVRAMLGYLPQDFRLFGKLKTWEFLDYSARLAGLRSRKNREKRVDLLLDSVGLLELRDRLADKLSGGMKRRLGIAQALVGDPKILVVDEPTTGLDPEERIRFRNILSELGQQDKIIILSTHIVGDISSTCSNLVLLNRGKIGFHGSPDEFVNIAKGVAWQLITDQVGLSKIKQKYPVIATLPVEAGWEVQFVAEDPDETNIAAIEPNLEHAYVHFMENILSEDKGMILES